MITVDIYIIDLEYEHTVYYSIWYWYTVIRLVKIDLLVPTKVNY